MPARRVRVPDGSSTAPCDLARAGPPPARAAGAAQGSHLLQAQAVLPQLGPWLLPSETPGHTDSLAGSSMSCDLHCRALAASSKQFLAHDASCSLVHLLATSAGQRIECAQSGKHRRGGPEEPGASHQLALTRTDGSCLAVGAAAGAAQVLPAQRPCWRTHQRAPVSQAGGSCAWPHCGFEHRAGPCSRPPPGRRPTARPQPEQVWSELLGDPVWRSAACRRMPSPPLWDPMRHSACMGLDAEHGGTMCLAAAAGHGHGRPCCCRVGSWCLAEPVCLRAPRCRPCARVQPGSRQVTSPDSSAVGWRCRWLAATARTPPAARHQVAHHANARSVPAARFDLCCSGCSDLRTASFRPASSCETARGVRRDPSGAAYRTTALHRWWTWPSAAPERQQRLQLAGPPARQQPQRQRRCRHALPTVRRHALPPRDRAHAQGPQGRAGRHRQGAAGAGHHAADHDAALAGGSGERLPSGGPGGLRRAGASWVLGAGRCVLPVAGTCWG